MDSEHEPNTTQPCPQFVDYLFFLASLTWCHRPKYFPYVHIYKSGIVSFSDHGDVCFILAKIGRGRPVKVDAILCKIVLKSIILDRILFHEVQLFSTCGAALLLR